MPRWWKSLLFSALSGGGAVALRRSAAASEPWIQWLLVGLALLFAASAVAELRGSLQLRRVVRARGLRRLSRRWSDEQVYEGLLQGALLRLTLRQREDQDLSEPGALRLSWSIPRPTRAQLMQEQRWSGLKAWLDRRFGLQFPALAGDPCSPGEGWKESAEGAPAYPSGAASGRGRRCRLSWDRGGLSVLVEGALPSVQELEELIRLLDQLAASLQQSGWGR